jgi:hypothetical protein
MQMTHEVNLKPDPLAGFEPDEASLDDVMDLPLNDVSGGDMEAVYRRVGTPRGSLMARLLSKRLDVYRRAERLEYMRRDILDAETAVEVANRSITEYADAIATLDEAAR